MPRRLVAAEIPREAVLVDHEADRTAGACRRLTRERRRLALHDHPSARSTAPFPRYALPLITMSRQFRSLCSQWTLARAAIRSIATRARTSGDRLAG
jgi:hypothetical protein